MFILDFIVLYFYVFTILLNNNNKKWVILYEIKVSY